MPRPTAIDASLRFRRQLEQLEAAAFQRMARIYARALVGLRDEVSALGEGMAALGGDTSKEDMIKLGRLRQIISQVKDEITRFGGTVQGEILIAQSEAIELAVNQSIQLIEASLPPGLPEELRRTVVSSFVRLPSDAVEAAAGLLGADSPLTQKITADFGEAVAEQVESHILDGVVAGHNPRRIAELLAANLEKSAGTGLSWAMSTVRTAQIKSYQLANHLTYQANSDIVPSWIWHSALDSRTCLSCINQHGSEHPVTESLNDHHRGRCAPIPKAITYADLGIRGVPGDDAPTLRGEDWFKDQPRTVQRQMMGNSRYNAWKAGAFVFRDLSTKYDDPVYGELLRESSLKGMLGKKAEAFYVR